MTTPRQPRAFSLVELMIAIVILGFGMIVVASMFPIAWQRTREMAEYTTERTITDSAVTEMGAILKVSGPQRNASSFAGDLIYQVNIPGTTPNYNAPVQVCNGWPSDPFVHALTMENLTVEDPRLVSENSYRLQDPDGFLNQAIAGFQNVGLLYATPFGVQGSFYTRVYPPLPEHKGVDATGKLANPDDRWENEFNTRRFAFGVLHRLRERLLPDPNAPTPPAVLNEPREFDLYMVTLRRPQSAGRYARQDPVTAPDPCNLANAAQSPKTPKPLPPEEDLRLPVPWRVPVQFETNANLNTYPTEPLGIPSEVTVPPAQMSGSEAEKLAVVEMFAPGAFFVDELAGLLFRVVKRRYTKADGTEAVLTLDREVVLEDLDIDPAGLPGYNNLCFITTPGALDVCEAVRTVWIYPPPVEPRVDESAPLVYTGSPPVVGIQVNTLLVTP